jgi:hypothetical protein
MKEAEALRDLAAKIGQLASEHEAFSMACAKVDALRDDLCCRARVIELTLQLPCTDDR